MNNQEDTMQDAINVADDNGIHSQVCGECGIATSSEPCPEHQPGEYAEICG